LEFKLKEKNK